MLVIVFSLKNESVKTVEGLDHQVQEQEKLRQNARNMLSIIQRTKVQLIELRPTLSGEGDHKLKVRHLSPPSLISSPLF
jgi:molybdopterin-guanine dinucleotide biosynthesis protein